MYSPVAVDRALFSAGDFERLAGRLRAVRHRQLKEERMIKVVVLLRRPQSWTRARFHRWWLDEGWAAA